MNAALKRKIQKSLTSMNVASATALADASSAVNAVLSHAHDLLGDTEAYKLYASNVLSHVAKALDAQSDKLRDDVLATKQCVKLVLNTQAGESASVDFDIMQLVLSKSKAPESLDSKALVNHLRTMYGTKLTKEVVDELILSCTKEGQPRKTFKVVQL